MYKKINIEGWNRKTHYEFFKDFSEPFYGVTVEIDCTIAYTFCKKNNLSFFIYYMHKALVVVNALEAFKYRIVENELIIYDAINVSATLNRSNGTFGFSYIDYCVELSEFTKNANEEIARVQSGQGILALRDGPDVIHVSAMPWLKFTALSHARNFSTLDTCPKITFGKMTDKDGIYSMPVSIHVHHALVDGIDIGKFVDKFQNLMSSEEL